MDDRDVSKDRAWRFNRLKWALQALAIPATDQIRLFPEWVVVPDELALDFDHWESVVRGNYEGELSQPQAARLAAVNRKLRSMSRGGADFDGGLWRAGSLDSNGHWAEVRVLANYALEAFGWPVESPPVLPHERGTTFIR